MNVCLRCSRVSCGHRVVCCLSVQVVRLASEETLERRGGELKGLSEQHDLDYVMAMIAYLDDRLT